MTNKFVIIDTEVFAVKSTRTVSGREILDLVSVVSESSSRAVLAESVTILKRVNTILCPKGYITEFEGVYLFTHYEKVLVPSEVPKEVVRGWLEYHSGEIL